MQQYPPRQGRRCKEKTTCVGTFLDHHLEDTKYSLYFCQRSDLHCPRKSLKLTFSWLFLCLLFLKKSVLSTIGQPVTNDAQISNTNMVSLINWGFHDCNHKNMLRVSIAYCFNISTYKKGQVIMVIFVVLENCLKFFYWLILWPDIKKLKNPFDYFFLRGKNIFLVQHRKFLRA